MQWVQSFHFIFRILASRHGNRRHWTRNWSFYVLLLPIRCWYFRFTALKLRWTMMSQLGISLMHFVYFTCLTEARTNDQSIHQTIERKPNVTKRMKWIKTHYYLTENLSSWPKVSFKMPTNRCLFVFCPFRCFASKIKQNGSKIQKQTNDEESNNEKWKKEKHKN